MATAVSRRSSRPRARVSCPECRREDAWRLGTQMTKKKGRCQRFVCNNCGHVWLRPLTN